MRLIPHSGSAARRILSFTARQLLAFAFLVACVLQIWTACGQKDTTTDPKILRGRVLFASNCISCHNSNPALDGTLGPAIKGSALELVQARAYELFVQRGYQHGHHLEDWLTAERELKSR